MTNREDATAAVNNDRIDPDPFVIVALWMQAAALILQSVQIYRDNRSIGDTTSELGPNVRSQLEQVENSLEDALAQLGVAHRAIERGCDDADAEYFDAPFGIGGSLKPDRERHQSYVSALSNAFNRVSNLGLWISNLISQHPDAAALLGKKLVAELDSSADRLNTLMRTRAQNREIIDECRRVISAADTALKAMVVSRRN